MIIGELCPEIDFDLLNCRKKKPPAIFGQIHRFDIPY
jgi:hypothetical protein